MMIRERVIVASVLPLTVVVVMMQFYMVQGYLLIDGILMSMGTK